MHVAVECICVTARALRRPMTGSAIEYANLVWVDWFNNCRLIEPNGNVPPAESKKRCTISN